MGELDRRRRGLAANTALQPAWLPKPPSNKKKKPVSCTPFGGQGRVITTQKTPPPGLRLWGTRIRVTRPGPGVQNIFGAEGQETNAHRAFPPARRGGARGVFFAVAQSRSARFPNAPHPPPSAGILFRGGRLDRGRRKGGAGLFCFISRALSCAPRTGS